MAERDACKAFLSGTGASALGGTGNPASCLVFSGPPTARFPWCLSPEQLCGRLPQTSAGEGRFEAKQTEEPISLRPQAATGCH